jgi:hypothetical protein
MRFTCDREVCGWSALVSADSEARDLWFAAAGISAVRALRCDTKSLPCLLYFVILIQPSFLQLVPYLDVRSEQSGRAKLQGQRNLIRKNDSIAVRRRCDCEHQCGRGLGSDGKGSERELPINVVSENKPKMLTGLNQKVCGGYRGSQLPARRRPNHRRIGSP